MRIAIIIERGQARSWNETGPWSEALAAALVKRNHEVTIICDAFAHKDRAEAAGITFNIWRTGPRLFRRRPLAFRKWARAQARDHDAAISLWRGNTADLWIPMGRPATAELKRLLSQSPLAIAMQSLARFWLPAAIIAEKQARAEARKNNTTPYTLTATTDPSKHTFQTASIYPALDQHALDTLRRQTRAILNIHQDAFPVLATSAAHIDDGGFDPLFQAIASIDKQTRPTLIITGGRPHRVMSLAHRHNIAESINTPGQTERMDAVIAASDAVIQPSIPSPTPGTARLAADAARLSRPFICTRSHHAAPLAAQTTDPTPESWRKTLTAIDHAWIERHTKETQSQFSIERLAQDIEQALRARSSAPANPRTYPPTNPH